MNEDMKTHFIMVFIFLVILSLATVTAGFCAYKVGKANGKLEGTLAAIQIHPPVTMTGANPVINNNVVEKDNHFKIGVFPLRIGWCG